MIYWGVNALNHGSSLAVFDGDRFTFDKFTENELPKSAIYDALIHGGPNKIFWYERPWVKKARQVYAGQYNTAADMSVLPRRYLDRAGLKYASLAYTPHHASHAAAGYYTSPFNHCAIVVLDAIGEFECATIWEAKHGEMKKVWSANYPNSLGLFYSAFTQFVGLTPIRDEYLLQKMAAQGTPGRFRSEVSRYFDVGPVALTENFHRGVWSWDQNMLTTLEDQCNLAAAVQERFEIEVGKVMYKAKSLIDTDCLVYMGGCAMNSQANKTQVESQFKYIWSLPDPGDPSSSIGAVLYHIKQRLRRDWDPVKHIAINT
jgi:carbamoyltransferase